MKKVVKSLLILVMLFCVTTACGKEEKVSDAIRFKEEYESLNDTIRDKDGKKIRSITIPEENPIIYKTAEELVEMIQNKETFVVYFGFTDCPWCRSMLPTLIDVANSFEIKQLYYVNIKDIRDTLSVSEDGELVVEEKGSDAYQKLLELLDNVLEEYTLTDKNDNSVDAKEKRIYAPNVVAVKDGAAIKLVEGISEKQTDGYEDLTEEMIQDMYEQLECVLKCIVDESYSCSQEKC